MVIFPPSGGWLAAIRKSSRDLRVSSDISIPPLKIKRLLFSPYFTSSFGSISKNHGLILPLKFSSYLDELNFISVLSLLNFGSGFRVPLHAQTGRGAWDSIRALALSLYITSTSEGDLLSAKGMRALTASKIAELMHINLHVERPHERISGITIGELGGPLYELVKMVTETLNETGEILEKSGYKNLGTFVLEALQQAGKVQESSAVEVVLERLVRAFPAFRDMSEVHGQPIYCFKKALFLIHAISIRFGSLSPQPFPIPNTSNVPIFSDNVLPSLLTHLGVIELPSNTPLAELFEGTRSPDAARTLLQLAEMSIDAETSIKNVPKEGPLVTTEQAYILRAAAIDACELIVETARTIDMEILEDELITWLADLTLPDLDMWLWSVAKARPDYRALERFVDQHTIYF